jgi:hypothetical protein
LHKQEKTSHAELLAAPERSDWDLGCTAAQHERMTNMLWAIVVIVLILWLLGFGFHIAGGLIHLLLVAALVIVIFNLLSGRRRIV